MRWLYGAGLVLLAGFAFIWALTRPDMLSDDLRAELSLLEGDAERGEQVFWAGGCAGCHAAPGFDMSSPLEDRLVLTGGRRLESDFGTFIAPNVSMHDEHGIGRWDLMDFANATLMGVSPGGAHYYPSFPYTSYIRMAPQDLADLWAFWQTLPADATPSEPHELGFPFAWRRGVGLWKRLNLRADFPTPEPEDEPAHMSEDEGENSDETGDTSIARGRYLAEALAHCAECHTPRTLTGALDRSAWMAGAPNPSGSGRIPAIPGEGWSERNLVGYLTSGLTPAADVVGGSMADVVVHMQQLPDADIEAIAAYIFWLAEGD